MTVCYLCESQAEINGQDYGRRKIVRCPSCEYYEITNTALSKLISDDFPKKEKIRIKNQVKEVNDAGGEALIVFENETINVIKK